MLLLFFVTILDLIRETQDVSREMTFDRREEEVEVDNGDVILLCSCLGV